MAQEGQGDDVKKRAFKRVAVAVVLALVAAAGLTMLSRSHKPAPQPEQTVLPAEPSAAVEQPASAVEAAAPETSPVPPVAETPPELAAPPATQPPPPPPQVINSKPPTSEPPAKAAKTLAAKPYAELPGSAPASAKPRPSQELVVASKEAVRDALAKSNGVSADAAKAPETKKTSEAPKTAEKTAPPPPVSGGHPPPAKNYTVQLGVFSNPENAIQMQEKLAQQGIKSYTETRLNVGPFNSKAEAEAAQAKLRGLGINAVVVSLSK